MIAMKSSQPRTMFFKKDRLCFLKRFQSCWSMSNSEAFNKELVRGQPCTPELLLVKKIEIASSLPAYRRQALLAMTTYAGIPVIANPSLPVILSEAKNLRLLLRVNSVKQSHTLLFYQELPRIFWRE